MMNGHLEMCLSIQKGKWSLFVVHQDLVKTTLLNLIGGLDHDFEGEIRVGGRARTEQSELLRSWSRNQEIGFVFQHFSLLDHLTVLDNILLPATFGASSIRTKACSRDH